MLYFSNIFSQCIYLLAFTPELSYAKTVMPKRPVLMLLIERWLIILNPRAFLKYFTEYQILIKKKYLA